MTKNSRGFKFPLPFDPFRLLLAALENLFWIALGALVLGLLGASLGWFRLGTSYKAPVPMLKESAPDNWQADPEGPYVPRPMIAEVLQLIAGSKDVLEMTAAQIDGVSADDLKDSVYFEDIAGQDIFQATAVSRNSAEEALSIAAVYADSITKVAIQRRRDEAVTKGELYAQHLEQKRAAIAGVSANLLQASSEGGVFDTTGQTASQLQNLDALRDKKQTAIDELEAAKGAITVYLEQSWVGPLRSEVRRLQRSRGANDPEVRARTRDLSEVESKLTALASEDGDYTVRSMADKVPSVVYRQLMTLRNELKVAKLKVDSSAGRITEAEAGLRSMPDKVLEVSDLQQQLKEQVAASVFIESRMKDAEFYSKTPPPPVQIMQPANLDDVTHRSAFFKAGVLGVAFTILGGLLVLGFVVVAEFFRRTVRTPLQAAIATSALPKLSYPQTRNGVSSNALRDFWLRSVGRFLPESRRFLFPVLGDVRGEETFWNDLFETLTDSTYRVVFMDFGRDQLSTAGSLPNYDYGKPSAVSRINPGSLSITQLSKIAAELPERHILLVRWDRDPDSALVELCQHIDRYYFITSGKDARATEVEYLGSIYRDLLGEADGVILAERRKPGRAKRIVSALEDWFIESRREDSAAATIEGDQL